MSSEPGKRAELVEALTQALRQFGDQNAMFGQAIADRLGINLTDFKCSSIVDSAGPLTAGQLAAMTGLTTGAITGVVDRLERAGLVRRVKDPNDRRQVIIQAAHERGPEFDEMLAPFMRAFGEFCARYSDKELGTILDFCARGTALLREEGAKLRASGTPAEAGEGLLSAPLDGVNQGRLRFSSGAARLTLRGGAIAELYRGTFEGRAPTVKVQDGAVSIQYARFSLFDIGKLGAELTLNSRIPWSIELRGGASKIEADLTKLKLELLEMSGGASAVNLVLPRPHGVVPVRISGGASRVTLRRPAGVPVRVQLSGGATKLVLDGKSFSAIGGSTRLEGGDARDAADRYDIDVSGGASHFTIEEG